MPLVHLRGGRSFHIGDPSRTATSGGLAFGFSRDSPVPFWGQTCQNPRDLSQKRDYGPKRCLSTPGGIYFYRLEIRAEVRPMEGQELMQELSTFSVRRGFRGIVRQVPAL